MASTVGVFRCPLLFGLTEAQQQALMRRMRRDDCAEGTAIISQGDVADRFFLIERGRVKILL